MCIQTTVCTFRSQYILAKMRKEKEEDVHHHSYSLVQYCIAVVLKLLDRAPLFSMAQDPPEVMS